MANEKIHEYLDSATLSDVQTLPVMIDCDVQEIGGWISKQLDVKNIIDASNDTGTRTFGQFHDNTIQLHTSLNSPKAMELNTTDFYNGIVINTDGFGRPTLIQVPSAGIYNLQFSAQVNRTTGGAIEKASIWFRQNGVDIPNSNTHVNMIANTTYLVASWNIYVDCQASDTIQLMWSVSLLTIRLLAEAPDLIVPHPATPSLIVTISKI
jgi:hypothetical protein